MNNDKKLFLPFSRFNISKIKIVMTNNNFVDKTAIFLHNYSEVFCCFSLYSVVSKQEVR
jgi:hypothetical protein